MEASNLARAIVFSIRSEIERVYWNVNQQMFYDAHGRYTGKLAPPLGIPGMEWRPWYEPDDDDTDYDNIGFTFEGVRFYWYKQLGRGLRVNVNWTAEKWEKWLERVMRTLAAWEYENELARNPYTLLRPVYYLDPAGAVPLELA